MNLIQSKINSEYNHFSNWLDKTPLNTIVDNVTYDQYECNNPFRNRFSEKDITNSSLRHGLNATNMVGAEIFSAFANPYYLTHKIVSVPIYYNNVVETYKHTKNKTSH